MPSNIEIKHTFIIFNVSTPEFIYNNSEEATIVLSRLNNINSNYHMLHIKHSENGICINTSIINHNDTTVINSKNICSITTKQTICNSDPELSFTNELNNELTVLNEMISNLNKTNISDSIQDIYHNIINDVNTNDIESKVNNVLDNEFIDDNKNTNDDVNNIIDTDTEEGVILQKLIEERNILNSNIIQQEKIINKANELLNEELFVRRCEEQEQKKLSDKQKEKISIFMSDKNTYLHINSKIKNNILKKNNIPHLFRQKYLVINFLELNDLITFTNNNIDTDVEYLLYEQLSKIIESYDAMDDNDTFDEILDDIDDELSDICNDFMDYLSDNEDIIISEKRLNNILNNDVSLKENIFGKNPNNDIFTNDIDKNEINSN